MEELVAKIAEAYASFIADANLQAEKGNKAAGTRARKTSLAIEKLLKEFRKASIDASNFAKMTDDNREETIEKTKEQVIEMLKQTIRPEFLNRIDETIMFTPLNQREIEEIVGLQIKSIKKMLARNGVTLEVTPAALKYLAEEGYDPEFGARPVKRVIHRLVLNRLSKDILAQKVDSTHPIVIDVDKDGELMFTN